MSRTHTHTQRDGLLTLDLEVGGPDEASRLSLLALLDYAHEVRRRTSPESLELDCRVTRRLAVPVGVQILLDVAGLYYLATRAAKSKGRRARRGPATVVCGRPCWTETPHHEPKP